MNGLLGVDVPGDSRPGVRVPADPDGLTSLDAGKESPVGPIATDEGFFGYGPTMPDASDTDAGRGESLGDSRGERGTASDWGLLSPLCTASMDVGGGSCGGETCGVIMAGSLLWSPTATGFPSNDDVPAGVRGGECMAEAGGDGRGPVD